MLRIDDVERPVPGDDELLIRVHTTTINRTDCGLRAAKPFFTRFVTGVRRPKSRIRGLEFAGEVVDVGSTVTEFVVGDRVFGVRDGAHAEYLCIRESGPIAHMPAGATFEEAAAVCDGAALALACLRKAGPLKGKSVLVYGATGSVGTAGVQLARHFGADVTAVANTKNLELVRSLGAHRVIDYTREDFTKNGETYDVVFDAVGLQPFTRSRRSLKAGGIWLGTDGMRNVPWVLASRRAALGITKYSKADVEFLRELMQTGAYRAVIDRRYALEDVVEATKYVETHQKTGNVVLTVTSG